MKKFFVIAIAMVIAVVMATPVLAVGPGKTVEFEGGGAGKVVFSGDVHAKAGNKCADCHQSGLFKMKKGADKLTMKEMGEGKNCGACHNGKKAFGVTDQASCSKCHKK